MSVSAADRPSDANLPAWYLVSLTAGILFALSYWLNDGFYSEKSLFFVLLGVIVALLPYLKAAATRGESTTVSSEHVVMIVWAVLFVMAFSSWLDPHTEYQKRPWETGRVMQIAGMALLLTYLPFPVDAKRLTPWLKLARYVLFGAMMFVIGVDVIRVSPKPQIDVWDVQMKGAEVLLAGGNPYTGVAVSDTGTGTDSVTYVYPPTQILLTLPGYLAGDVRYTMLASLLIAGLCLRAIVRRSRRPLPSIVEDAPGLSIWLAPKLFFIVEQAWMDPVTIMLLSVALLLHVHQRPIVAAVVFGVAISSKQTMIWAGPLIGFLLCFDWKRWLMMLGTAALLILPFAFADFEALKRALIDAQVSGPERTDALTFTNWAKKGLKITVSGYWAFPLAAVATGVAIWRMRGSTARLAIALVATYALFITFNRWAFANYFFVLSGLGAIAAATAFHGGLPAVREQRAAPTPERVPVANG